MSSKSLFGRLTTLSIVGTLLTAGLLVTVGAIASAGAVGGTSPLTPAVSDVGNDTIGATAFASDDAVGAPAAIGHAPAQTGERNRIVFDHTEGPRASYEVTVSGSIEAGPEADLTDAESVDRIRGNRATGSIAEGGDDDYFFTGEITSLEVDGPITVYVNGEQVDPDDFDGATATTATPSTTTAATTTTTTTIDTETDTETSPLTETATETETTTTDTETPTATETQTPASTTETTTETATSSPTATPNGSLTTTGAANGGSEGFTDQERGLFLTIGGVLLLGVLVIAGFVWFARQQ